VIDLAPFWKDAQSYWSPDGCRDFTTLGYTYPEFVGQDLSNKAQLRSAILAKVNSLYGSKFIRPVPRSLAASVSAAASSLVSQLSGKGAPKAAPAAAPAAPKPAAASKPPPRPAATAAIANPDPNDEFNMVDWRVRILSPKYKLGGAYSILVFLGPVPEQISEWRNSGNLVGTVEVFANIQPDQCANCRSRPDLTIEGTVYLNQVLARSPLRTFEPQAVAAYLKENLHWRVTKVCSETFNLTLLRLTSIVICRRGNSSISRASSLS
jgi:tyrosinase